MWHKTKSHEENQFNKNNIHNILFTVRYSVVCPGRWLCRNHRGNRYGNLVFRPGNKSHLCHRCHCWFNWRRKSLQQILQWRPRYRENSSFMVWSLYFPDCVCYNSTLILFVRIMASYSINKGVNKPAEFKGLQSQYLFIFAGGLLGSFLLFIVLYMAGVNQWLCIFFGVILALLVIWLTISLNKKYGQFGLMKLQATKNFPRRIINRRSIPKLFTQKRKELA